MNKSGSIKHPGRLPAGPARRPGVNKSVTKPLGAQGFARSGVLLTLAFLLVVILVVGRRSASMTVTNLAPHAQWFAVARPTVLGRWETIGWVHLGAGQGKSFESTFWFAKPEFYVAARSADEEVVRYLYGDGEVAFEGGGATLVRNVTNATMHFRTDSSGSRTDGEGGYPEYSYPVEFARAVEMEDGSNFAFTIFDPYFPHLSYPPTSEPADLQAAAQEAGWLGESLQRQAKFTSKWGGKPFPFHLNTLFEDPNGFAHLGIEIAAAKTLTRDGYPMRLFPGDTLIEFAGHRVYSPQDVLALLNEHATDLERGVDVPIAFAVQRAGVRKDDITTYSFNRDFWQRKDADAVIAGWLGITDAVTFSNGAAANAAMIKVLAGTGNGLSWLASKLDPKYEPKYVKTPPYKELRWGIRQNQARLREFENTAYDLGAFAGFFVQPTRSVVRPFLGRTGRAVTGSFAGRVAWEVGESTVWTLADGSPMRRPEELHQDLRTVMPFAAFGGALQGTLRLVRR